MVTIRVSKLDAARRQLRAAIELWFTDGDPVAIHTLTFAAYEILHALSKKRDPNRPKLLFDSDLIMDDKRSQANTLLKRNAYFFKHADRDGDSVIEFNPEANEWLMVFASRARSYCGELPSEEESCFMWWMQVHHPHMLTEEGQKELANLVPVEHQDGIRRLPKREFFEAMMEGRRLANRRTSARPARI